MLCLTGNEKTGAKLLERLQSAPEAGVPVLMELRYDRLQEDVSLEKLVSLNDRIVFTCRPAWEGGGFEGSEQERFEILQKAVDAGVWAVDVELDSDLELRDAFLSRIKSSGVKLILSYHTSNFVTDVAAELEKLHAVEADYYKFVAPVASSAELTKWLELGNDGRDVLIASGAAGSLTRFLFRKFSSPWTYIARNENSRTAEFQPTLQDLESGRLSLSEVDNVFLVMGGPQVVNSKGARVYNPLFKKRGYKGNYQIAIGDDAQGLMELASKLGVKGASVTKPLKESVLPFIDELDETVLKVGAVNSIRWDEDKIFASNTDVQGVIGALEELYENAIPQKTRVLFLGAGGAARAVAYALTKFDFEVTVANRSYDKAQALAGEFDLECMKWEERGDAHFDLLINATSIGMDDSEATPYEWVDKLYGKYVLDVVSHPDPTRLVKEAKKAGAKALGGRPMWIHQGIGQLDFWLDWDVDREKLEALL